MTDLVPVDTFALVPAASDLASQIAATDFAPQGLRGKPAAAEVVAMPFVAQRYYRKPKA